MDAARRLAFFEAAQTALAEARAEGQIGTLGEKRLHATLKHFIEPDVSCHERMLGRFHADVVVGSRIYEVQTASFHRLRPKLEAWLDDYSVEIVYPIPALKWLRWIDPETMLAGPPRRSPKRGAPIDVCRELASLRRWLGHPRLSLRLLLLEVEETRLQDGWGRDGKRGSHRYERIPLDLLDEVVLASPADYAQLLPPLEGEQFGSLELARASARPRHLASLCLRLLRELGVVELVGREARAHVYALT